MKTTSKMQLCELSLTDLHWLFIYQVDWWNTVEPWETTQQNHLHTSNCPMFHIGYMHLEIQATREM